MDIRAEINPMYSFLFLTATWATGQATSPPEPGHAPQAVSVRVLAETPSPARGGMLGRVRGLLGRRTQVGLPVVQTPPSWPQPMPSGPPLPPASPYASVPLARAPAPATVAEEVTAQRPDLEVRLAGEARMGHEPDYRSLTGYLYYVRADGGRWVVRYAGLDQMDRYGGSVVLAPGVEMKNFREGDLVCVQGEILDGGRASRSLGGAHYRVHAITMLERGDP
jgi:hypothetical protein